MYHLLFKQSLASLDIIDMQYAWSQELGWKSVHVRIKILIFHGSEWIHRFQNWPQYAITLLLYL